MDSTSTRREFLAANGRFFGGTWLLLELPLLAGLAACARDAARTGESFVTLTEGEGAAMRAFAARIIPTDEEPGAEEAGAAYFADRALAGPFSGMAGVVLAGLRDLDARAEARWSVPFAEIPSDAQDELIRELQDTEFFASARALSVMGVLADPSYGGNRNSAADRVVGISHASTWQPPFGYYDAEYARGKGAAE